jgi:hypothetical protein
MSRSLVLLALSAAMAWAQAGLATLTGTISDPSGAVIASAPVSATHIATGTVLSAATSSTGNYTISNMPIGGYQVTVEMPGFKTYHREGVQLALQQTLRIDISLEVGSQAESITVTAETTMMKTDSGQVTHNITMREIQNLPITPVSGVIRDPFSVAQLIPGVRYIGGAGGAMYVNGLPASAVQYRIDGQVMGNSRTGFTSNTQQVQPSVDAVEEVAIVTSNYAAEFGSVAGALFNVTMRSGTKSYHGSVYDYAVNEILNARDPSVHLRDKLRRHDWGATFGGPLRIPKLYEQTTKTFFFAAWERYNQVQVAQVSAATPTVPIQAYRDGDFSRLISGSGNRNLTIGTGTAARDYRDPLGATILAGTIFDPASTRQVACNTALSQDCTAGAQLDYRTAFPGNRIPVTLFDPVAKAIQDKYIPLPLGARAAANELFNNYLNPFTTTRLSIIPSFKIDHNLGSKTRLNAYWQMTKTQAPVSTTFGAEGFNDTITSNRGTYQTATRSNLNIEHTLTPTTQFHLGIAWSHFDWSDSALVTDYNPGTDIGLKGVRQNRNFPRFAANTQNTAGGVGLGGMSAMGVSPQGANPERRPAANTSLTWIRKNHTIKFGAEWRMDILPTLTYTNTAGNFGALGNGITWQPTLLGLTLSGAANVGFPYADFLLGSVRGFTMSTPIAYRTSKHQWGIYVQDTWRVRRNLTLDYGLRWDLGTYTKEDYGRNAGLSLTQPNPSADGRLGGLIYEAQCKCQFAQNYPFGIGPRLGFAYTMNSKTVIRGGFGIAYGSTGTFGGFAQNGASAPTAVNGTDNFKMRDGVPAAINPEWPVFNPALGHAAGTVVAAQALLDSNAGRPSRTYQWNISAQRELTRNLVLEASYVANRGIWQDAGGIVSHNAVSQQSLSRYGFNVGNLDDATMLNAQVRNLTSAQASTLRTRGVVLPYASFPTTQTVFQSIRPYPQYSGGISPSSAPLGKSWYDSLQVTLNKRFSHGLQINANYTWSKNLSAQSLADVFNRNYANKDIDGLNLPQRTRVSFEYQTPRPYAGMPILGNKVVANIVAGWGIAMRLSYQSAGYLGRPAHGATNGINRWLFRGPGGAQLRTDANGQFMNPWSVNWTDLSGAVRTDPIDVNCHCFDPEKTLVFNPAAWQAVPDGQWAAQNPVIPWFRGVRLPQEDANLSRTFRMGPDGRISLQVRVEFQNVLNRLKLPGPQIAGLNFNTVPTPTTDGRYTSGFGTFGNLRNPNTFGAERTGMFVGRLTF